MWFSSLWIWLLYSLLNSSWSIWASSKSLEVEASLLSSKIFPSLSKASCCKAAICSLKEKIKLDKYNLELQGKKIENRYNSWNVSTFRYCCLYRKGNWVNYYHSNIFFYFPLIFSAWLGNWILPNSNLETIKKFKLAHDCN